MTDAVVLLALYVSYIYSYLGTSMLPVLFHGNLRIHGFVQVPQARGRQHSLINVRAIFMMS